VTVLINVFAEWFRSFGYTIALADPTRPDGPLLVERDARRLGVFSWLKKEPLQTAFLEECTGLVKTARLDGGILLCLAPAGDALRTHWQPHGLHIWDTQRIIQELGEAVLGETLPDVWVRTDPLLAPRPSKLMAAAQPAKPTAPAAEPTKEAPFPVAAPPILAQPADQTPTQLELPLAFGVLDVEPAQPSVPTAPLAASVPAAAPAATPLAASRPSRPILRSQVSRALAVSMVKKKVRTVDRVFLRLTPYHVYDYEAHLLVDGSLDAEVRKGRMGVEATQKRVVEWAVPLETGELNVEGADVDEKKVRVADADAQAALRQELVKIVTRDVVMQEDDDEWSVVVKKKVNLGPADVKLQPKGIYWVPVWRIAGPEGAVEIDASTGNVVFEELIAQRSDSQLI
jgi:hypothetical protein